METKQNKEKKKQTFDDGRQEIITKYLSSIGHFDPLSYEQTVAMAKKAREGDKEAFDELLKRNLKYVVSVAKTCRGRGVPFEDLISEGNLGLMKAIEKYDPDKGFRFTTYAKWWILNSIHKCVDSPYQVNVLKESDIIQNSYREDYYDRGQGNDSIINDDNELEYYSSTTSQMMQFLDVREKEIIKGVFGFDGEVLTLEEIGGSLGMTVERVRQLKEGAMIKLRTVAMQMSDDEIFI